MRRVLIEAGPADRKRRKRGGLLQRGELADPPAPPADDRLLALDESLTRLAGEDPVAARVVELHHFAGLGHEQVAAALASPFTRPGRSGPTPGPGSRTPSAPTNGLRTSFDSRAPGRRTGGRGPGGPDPTP